MNCLPLTSVCASLTYRLRCEEAVLSIVCFGGEQMLVCTLRSVVKVAAINADDEYDLEFQIGTKGGD